MIRLPAGAYSTIDEYAERAGITVQAVYKAIRQDRLKAYRIGHVYLIKSDALIVNRTIRSGKYIGLRALMRGDEKSFMQKRGMMKEGD